MAGGPSNIPDTGSAIPPEVSIETLPSGKRIFQSVQIQIPTGKSETYTGPVQLPFSFNNQTLQNDFNARETKAIAAVQQVLHPQPQQPIQQAQTGNQQIMENVLDQMGKIESNNNPNAVSPKGALGMYQIMPQTGAQYGISNPNDLFNPQVGRNTARTILTDLLGRYKGDWQLALAAYNAGPGNVDKGIFPRETQNYVSKFNLANAMQAQQLRQEDQPLESGRLGPSSVKMGKDVTDLSQYTFQGKPIFGPQDQKIFDTIKNSILGQGDIEAKGGETVSKILGANGEPIKLTPEMQTGEAVTKPIELGAAQEAESTQIPRSWESDYRTGLERQLRDPEDTKFTQMPERTALNSTEMAQLGLAESQRIDNIKDLGIQLSKATTPEEKQIVLERGAQEIERANILRIAHSNAGTEAGQALSIRQLTIQNIKQANDILAKATPENVEDVLRSFATLGDGTEAEKVAKAETFLQKWFNGVNPYTALITSRMLSLAVAPIKLLSDTVKIPYNITMQTAGFAATHPLQLPTAGRIFTSGFEAIWDGMKAASEVAEKTWQTNEPVLTNSIKGDVDVQRYGLETLDALKKDRLNDLSPTYPDRIMNYISTGLGTGVRAIMTASEFALALSQHVEMRTQSLAMGLEQAEKEGLIWNQALSAASDYAESFMRSGAVDHLANANAARDVFVDSDRYTDVASAVLQKLPFLRLIAPMVHTGLNLWEESLMNSLGAPLTAKFWDDVTGASGLGNLTRNATYAKMATGTAFLAWTMWRGASGYITGDYPPDGNPNHARCFRFGDTYISYSHIPTISTMLSMAANYSEYGAQMQPGAQHQMSVALAKAFGDSVSSAPGLSANIRLMRIVDDVKRSGYSKESIDLVSKAIGNFNPEVVQSVAHAIDPVEREAKGSSFLGLNQIWQNIEKDLPGLSKNVPPNRDLFANEQYFPPGTNKDNLPPHWYWSLLNGMNPATIYQGKEPDDVDKELIRLNLGPSLKRAQSTIVPDSKFPKMSIPLDRWQQDRWDVLSGNGVTIKYKNQPLNQHDYMQAVINSDAYKKVPSMYGPGEEAMAANFQRQALESVHQAFLRAGMMQLIHTDPNLLSQYKNTLIQQSPVVQRARMAMQ